MWYHPPMRRPGLDALILLIFTFVDIRILLQSPEFGEPEPTRRLLVTAAGALAFLYFAAHRAPRLKSVTNACLAGVILLLAILPMMQRLNYRRMTRSDFQVHDSAIQLEAAADFLLAGVNPFQADYRKSALGAPGMWLDSPALDCFPYVGLLYPSTAIRWLGRIDIRWLHLAVFLAMLAAIPGLAPGPPGRRRALLAAIALNPLFLRYMHQGRTDLFPLAGLVWAARLWPRYPIGSLAAASMAVAAKQTAWFALPLYALWTAGRGQAPPLRPRTWADLKTGPYGTLAIAGVVWGTLALPFVIWDWRSFVHDVIFCGMQMDQTIIRPAYAEGFANVVLAFGGAHAATRFPYGWARALACGAVLVALVRRLDRRNDAGTFWTGATLLTAVGLFLGPFFVDSYIGYISQLALLAGLAAPKT